jgi:hypothetical protein
MGLRCKKLGGRDVEQNELASHVRVKVAMKRKPAAPFKNEPDYQCLPWFDDMRGGELGLMLGSFLRVA